MTNQCKTVLYWYFHYLKGKANRLNKNKYCFLLCVIIDYFCMVFLLWFGLGHSFVSISIISSKWSLKGQTTIHVLLGMSRTPEDTPFNDLVDDGKINDVVLYWKVNVFLSKFFYQVLIYDCNDNLQLILDFMNIS